MEKREIAAMELLLFFFRLHLSKTSGKKGLVMNPPKTKNTADRDRKTGPMIRKEEMESVGSFSVYITMVSISPITKRGLQKTKMMEPTVSRGRRLV